MPTKSKLVSVNIVVHNGEKWIRQTLDSVKKQNYKNIEVNILDNDSDDETSGLIEKEYPEFNLIRSEKNLGIWPGQEELLKFSKGEYIAALTDVVLDLSFIKEAAKVLDKDLAIGAVEPKIYQMKTHGDQEGKVKSDEIIDTCGFKIYKNRRIVNIGQGEKDTQESVGGFDFSKEQEIFAVEGAAPVFRRRTLEDCRVDGEIADHDMFWYGDDLDLGWRMRLFGWMEVYAPKAIAWHDRSTTKIISKSFWDHFKENLHQRKQIPINKRRLDWINSRIAIIKNDQAVNLFKDLPRILIREIAVLGYTLIFEPAVLSGVPRLLRLIPKALKKRHIIMKRSHTNAREMRKWFI